MFSLLLTGKIAATFLSLQTFTIAIYEEIQISLCEVLHSVLYNNLGDMVNKEHSQHLNVSVSATQYPYSAKEDKNKE